MKSRRHEELFRQKIFSSSSSSPFAVLSSLLFLPEMENAKLLLQFQKRWGPQIRRVYQCFPLLFFLSGRDWFGPTSVGCLYSAGEVWKFYSLFHLLIRTHFFFVCFFSLPNCLIFANFQFNKATLMLIDWLIDRWMDGWVDWLIDWLMNGWMDEWIDWLIDWWMNGSIDWSIDWLIVEFEKSLLTYVGIDEEHQQPNIEKKRSARAIVTVTLIIVKF